MSFVYLFLWWLIATSLGIGAIVALEPLWRESDAERLQCAEISAAYPMFGDRSDLSETSLAGDFSPRAAG